MKLHQVVTAILVILLLAAIVRSPLEGRSDAEGGGEPIALALVRASPDSFLGKELEFVVQVHAVPMSWNPFVTRFGSADFRALSVWTDEQALWVSEEFEHPFGPVFARRGTPVEALFAAALPYQRYRMHGRVKECFLGRAWIEVDSATRLSGEVGEGTVLHAGRAVQLMAAQQWKLALEDLERALAGELPARAVTELEELRTACAEALSKSPR
ncbi:MAG: hypothetical protein HZA52_16545 [Planctomycetes bacterium]|nr:hypothetical protein [Planctomycetota bacterium]